MNKLDGAAPRRIDRAVATTRRTRASERRQSAMAAVQKRSGTSVSTLPFAAMTA
jgi:hypothetical protein